LHICGPALRRKGKDFAGLSFKIFRPSSQKKPDLWGNNMTRIREKRAPARRDLIACAPAPNETLTDTFTRKTRWAPHLVLGAAIALLVTVAAPPRAYSFETTIPSSIGDLNGIAPGNIERAPATSADANCDSLLRSASFAPTALPREQTAMDRDADASSAAAALGLVFGVHFALGPKQVTGRGGSRPQFDVWQPSAANSKALAIAAYSRCRREAALRALSESD
jgi:hypothetical protein